MLVVNVDFVPDQELLLLSIVQGSTISSNHLDKGVSTSSKTSGTSSFSSYSERLAHARKVATEHMISEAKKLNADAIINVRFTSNLLMEGTCEIIVYGTAVKYKYTTYLQQF